MLPEPELLDPNRSYHDVDWEVGSAWQATSMCGGCLRIPANGGTYCEAVPCKLI